MKLLFDQNVSPKLPQVVADVFPDSMHVRELGLDHADDSSIWEYARDHSYAVVTKDVDYLHLSALLGHPPKLVWLAVGNCATGIVSELLRVNTAAIYTLNSDPTRSFIVLPPNARKPLKQ